MTDRGSRTPPEQVEVTAEFLTQAAAKQKAYQARRRMWTAAFQPSEPRTQALTISRRRGTIHDPRQKKLDL
jgi:hypothetical protein